MARSQRLENADASSPAASARARQLPLFKTESAPSYQATPPIRNGIVITGSTRETEGDGAQSV